MTCKEKLRQDHPEMNDFEFGLAIGTKCPADFGYPENPKLHCEYGDACAECWDQPYEEREQVDHSPAVQAWIEHMEEKEPHIKDSGDRTQFESGAVRDMREGKGRCDLMPLEVAARAFCDPVLGKGEYDINLNDIRKFQIDGLTCHLYYVLRRFARTRYDGYESMLLEVAKHFEEGAKKYGENNWQKGIPVHCYIDSAVRHYLKWRRGDKDEPHDRAFVWNLMCCIWEVDYHIQSTNGSELKSADFLEKHLNIPDEEPDKWVRLEDCPIGLFEFSGKIYLKAGRTVVHVNTGTVEPLHPDILVWPIEIEEDE